MGKGKQEAPSRLHSHHGHLSIYCWRSLKSSQALSPVWGAAGLPHCIAPQKEPNPRCAPPHPMCMCSAILRLPHLGSCERYSPIHTVKQMGSPSFPLSLTDQFWEKLSDLPHPSRRALGQPAVSGLAHRGSQEADRRPYPPTFIPETAWQPALSSLGHRGPGNQRAACPSTYHLRKQLSSSAH